MTKKDKAKQLWDSCFTDSKEFTKLYFDKRYTDENTVALMQEDQMTSMLQLLPYPFLFLGQITDTLYISGACTHPNFRNQGLMQKLLVQAFKQIQKENISLCTLIPAEDWLFNYYQKSGFETVFHQATYQIQVPKYKQDSNVVVTFNNTFNEESYSYLANQMKKRPSSILHTPEDFQVILADLRLAEGQVFTARIQTKIVGIALAYYNPIDKQIHVNEILSKDICINQELFQAMSSFYNTDKISVITAPYKENKDRLGMLRIIQATPILRIFAKNRPQWKTSFYLQDPLLPENEGVYQIQDGKVSFNPKGDDSTYQTISINELALRLFEPLAPYMSLMLN